jgi:cytochrome c oxidase assembly protein subunit 19|eukprot:gene12416-8885_t
MTDAFGASRVQIRPPERGVFPLDHDGECKDNMGRYLACLKENHNDAFPCRVLSKAYLQCRMDRDLMAKEEMSKLGLDDNQTYVRVEANEGTKETSGFVAGLGVRPSSKWLGNGPAKSH